VSTHPKISLKKIYATKGESQDSVALILWNHCSECNGSNLPLPDYVSESKEVFTHRFMGDPGARKKYKEDLQRRMVAEATWNQSGESVCSLSKKCQYIKRGYCAIEVQYLNAVCSPVLRLLQDPAVPALTEIEFLEFGLKYLPLHHDLIRIKRAIAALSDILVVTQRGGIQVHPLYREKREVIKSIEGLDITRVLREHFIKHNLRDVTPMLSDADLEQYGDPDFADSLSRTE